MTMEPQGRCPDCDGALHAIRLLDKADAGLHTDLEYAAVDSTMSYWTGKYPVEGKVAAFLCAGCGRILLYGAHKPPA